MKQIPVTKVPNCGAHTDHFVCDDLLQRLNHGETFVSEVALLDVQLPSGSAADRLVELCDDCRRKYYIEGGFALVGGLDKNFGKLPTLPL